MNIKRIAATLLMAVLLISCKVVNTHAFKITSSPEIGATEVRLATTKGHLFLSTELMSDTQRELLKGMLPYQCLAVTTAEPFDMQNRTVRFREFKLKKLASGESACKEIRVGPRISVS